LPAKTATLAICRLRAVPQRAFLLVAAWLLASVPVAGGATFGGGGGVDWSAGPGDQSTSAASAYAVTSGVRASVALGVLRFDDRFVGPGYGFLGALALQPRDGLILRAWSARHVGEGAFRGWRIKAGPEWVLPRESTLGLFYAHHESSLDGVLQGGSVEIATPVAPRFTARAAGGHLRGGGSVSSSQGTLGVTWAPIARLELSADAGLAHNGAFLSAGPPQGPSGSGGGGLGLPPGLLPGGSSASHVTPSASRFETAPTIGLGIRVALP